LTNTKIEQYALAQCCLDRYAERPVEGAVDPKWLYGIERTLQEQYDLDKWFYEFEKHLEGEDHVNQWDALEPERDRRRECSDKMHEIINEYEDRTMRTCETCGKDAALASTGGRGTWYKTLCTQCAEELGYMIIEEEDNE